MQHTIFGVGKWTISLISSIQIGILQNTAVRGVLDLATGDSDSPLSSAQPCYRGRVPSLLWLLFLHPSNKGENQLNSKTYSHSKSFDAI